MYEVLSIEGMACSHGQRDLIRERLGYGMDQGHSVLQSAADSVAFTF
jgi:hypothetical protein